MNTSLSFALLPAMMLALSSSLTAAPVKKDTSKPPAAPPALEATLNVNPRELAPESTIEVVFPTPMVSKDRIGTTEPQSPLTVKPELQGSFEWTSTRSGHFHLAQSPKFATSYTFQLRDGLADLTGRPLATGELDSLTSARFAVVDQYPKWFGDEMYNRRPVFLFEFNDNVTPADAARHIRYVSEAAPNGLPAQVRHALGRDFEKRNAQPQQTWAEQIAKAKPAVQTDSPRLSALIIEPVEPLPVGKEWRLEIAESLTDASGHHQLSKAESIQLGDVRPFVATSADSHTPFDAAYFVDIHTNRSLIPQRDEEWKPEELAALAQKIAESVTVEPAPAGALKAEVSGSTLTLSGAFQIGQAYKITVRPGITSGDGLVMEKEFVSEMKFVPNPPYVAAPAFMNSQLAKGAGNFEFTMANVSQVRVRAKRLAGAELLQAMDRYKTYPDAFWGGEKQKAAFKTQPFDSYPGTAVYDRVFPCGKPLDQSELVTLKWSEVLAGQPTGALFIEMEGTGAPGAPGKGVVTQSLVQFTDIGLMQKCNGKETLAYVTSLETGAPLSGVRLTLVDADLKLLGYGDTDAGGMAKIAGPRPAFVLAERNGDATVMPCNNGESTLSLPWDINEAYEDVWQPQRRTFIFADRPLYKPGETAHLKAHTRLLIGDDLSLDTEPRKGRLTVRDPRYRTVIDKEVTFTADGSWADDLVLPTGPLGSYEVQIKLSSGAPDSQISDAGSISLRVDDYKPNTFEVKLDTKATKFTADRIQVPLKANYLMGKPITVANIEWSANAEREYQPPQLFSDYHFGDAPSWAHYGQDRDSDGDYIDRNDDDEENEWFVNGDLLIGDDGTATLEMPMPPADRAALPQIVRVQAEVTDVNEQTISTGAEFQVPGARHILGLKGPQSFANAGKATTLEIIAITPDGKAPGTAVKTDVRIERQQYHTLKIATAGGGTTTKDQVILQEQYKQSHDLKPITAGGPPAASIAFTPPHGGIYFLTAESTDADGKKVISRMPFYVVGGNEFPWAMEDGSRMNLQPEKTSYKPGEEAVIVVKTPIAGTALVTVERNRVHSSFTAPVTLENPVIRIPVTEADAPNMFISVIVIRGSAQSPKKDKMPEYRIGVCALKVESNAKDLAITLKPDKTDVRPGETVAVSATVKDAAGAAVTGADVTLFAVDEGVLSLMKFKTPDPRELFHAEFPLAVDGFTSFDGLLPEEFAARDRGNKGFVIGGGAAMAASMGDMKRVRANFITTPLWLASARTDAEGKITASFVAPDNLTRFRIMAVAAHGTDRFGSAEDAVQVNKPLMIEPAIPRFARLGDEFLVKAVLHNTSKQSGRVEVILELDATSSFIAEKRDFVPASLREGVSGDAKRKKAVVSLKAGETASVAFPVVFDQLGTATWKWATSSLDFAQPESDALETKFEVEHPLPELRHIKYARLKGSELPANLIPDVNPALLEGQGSLRVSVSNTRLYEASDALEYLLQYPYGCVEQTTSATVPWLALGKYESLFPAQLGGGKAQKAIQAGVNKILQMTTDEGGLSYWPGGQESSLWGSAYGGLMLLRARDQGASVPAEVIDKLVEFLSKRLRGLEEEKDLYVITDCAFALYTLAKAGKPEPAYMNLLYSKRERLPEVTRLYLALAMCLNNTPDAQIKETLGWKPPEPPAPTPKAADKNAKSKTKTKTKTKTPAKPAPAPAPPIIWGHWAGSGVNKALRLIAYTHLGLTEDAEKLAVSILQSRDGRGAWGNTYANAWTLTALTAYERSLKKAGEPLVTKAIWDATAHDLVLSGPAQSSSVNFALNEKLASSPLRIEMPADRDAFARIEARAFPPQREFAGENKGYAITRTYEKLNMDGTTTGIDDLRVGDMVVVSLAIEIGGGDRYLAIDDPLPAVFEAINPEFASMNEREGGQLPDGTQAWFCDHREIRSDRALFFTDYAPAKGKFTLRYLARVNAEGDATAPPARIEAMYQPEKYGLSPTQKVRTLPATGGVTAQK